MLPRAVVRLSETFLQDTRCNQILSRQRLPLVFLSTNHLPNTTTLHTFPTARPSSSSSSSTRWKSRQNRDPFTRDSKLAGLKSRAAFKLLEIDAKHHLFRPGDTVVDLGYAPGSWSQVAVNRTQPGGRVVGIDVIPAQPPRGVSTLQGDFLSPDIREEVRDFVRDWRRGRVKDSGVLGGEEGWTTEEELDGEGKGLEELERASRTAEGSRRNDFGDQGGGSMARNDLVAAEGRVVDVVLSDMCEPWPQVSSTWIKSVSNPYRRMMNTSGMTFRDHAGSMDLCNAALSFCFDTLVTGGHFLCKFYQGAEDHALEVRLKKLFEKVHRIKPDSSRKENWVLIIESDSRRGSAMHAKGLRGCARPAGWLVGYVKFAPHSSSRAEVYGVVNIASILARRPVAAWNIHSLVVRWTKTTQNRKYKAS